MHTIVVGAGIAGLLTATRLARAGVRVTVLERAARPGGRGATTLADGFALNLGPHALYRAGAAHRALTALGISVEGRDPGPRGHVLHGDALHPLPGSPWSFATTSLFDLRDRMQALAFARHLLFDDPARFDRVSVQDWLAGFLDDPTVLAWARGMVRVFTYGNDPARQSAGAVLRQGRLGVRHGVLYLDGGWGRIVEALRAAAEAAGVTIRTGAHVEALDGTRVRVGEETLTGDALVIATPLAAARTLLPELPAAPPVRAACLDLALRPEVRVATPFVLGADRPLYLSVHTGVADLGPGHVVHVAHYLGPDEHADVAELEALADRALPGWRDAVVQRRWAPALVVQSALDLAERPRAGVVARPGVYVAGDWVGPDGQLVDASAASAWAAADAILAARAARACPPGSRPPASGVGAGPWTSPPSSAPTSGSSGASATA